ncbi:hypothetical protein HWV62_7463 [Athelia sp. TMB]|nr:hypothetical protein HWV62_7463 [Athelia sp. TMB]
MFTIIAQNESAGLSLLSLSAAAASAVPIPVKPAQDLSTGGSNGAPAGSGNASGGIAHAPGLSKHRRLSSAGKAKRRLSDARDAASRPSATALQTAATALATLSLSVSPTHAQGASATSFNSFRTASAIPIPRHDDASPHPQSHSTPSDDSVEDSSHSDVTKGGKKRGTTFTCESCSKVYRHPSCLIKHRWEHAPQWREASKFVLSKHQQVQLLEAAAILSHLSPGSAGTSLPEDRSLWPSFLSGGTLPPPATHPEHAHPRVSSSVPAASAFSRAGPRMHEYPVGGGLTQLRPGVLGVSTGSESGSSPVPVPVPRGMSASSPSPPSSYPYAPHSHGISQSVSYSDGAGGWSLPRSSLRSMSMSRSSASPSSDEPLEVEVEDGVGAHPRYRWGMKDEDDMSIGFSVREEDEDGVDEDMVKPKESEEAWDGMDMDMLMD